MQAATCTKTGRCFWQLQQGQQLPHFLHPGSPAGGDPHHRVGVVVFFPEAELCLALQRFQLGVGEDHEDLVGGGVHEELVAFFRQTLFQHGGRLNGVFADLGVQAVGEEHIELQTHQAALGQQSALLLDHGHKVGGSAVGEDDSLAAERTYLGAADVEHIGQAGNVSQRDIGALADQTVAQPGTVHEQGHVVGVADGGKCFQLSLVYRVPYSEGWEM